MRLPAGKVTKLLLVCVRVLVFYEYLHACLGAPTVTTLIDAINNNRLTTFPGLTANEVRKHLPKSIQINDNGTSPPVPTKNAFDKEGNNRRINERRTGTRHHIKTASKYTGSERQRRNSSI